MKQRRDFLKQSAAVALGIAGVAAASRRADADAAANWSMIIDLNRCTGCQSCVIACKARHHTSAGLFNTRVEIGEAGNYPQARSTYRPVLCHHCQEPACARACRHGAITVLANGIVAVDPERCKGDSACITACPHRACFLDPASGRMDKCDFCRTRLDQGLVPACVEACSSGARLFGDTLAPEGEFAAALGRTATVAGERVTYVRLRQTSVEKKS